MPQARRVRSNVGWAVSAVSVGGALVVAAVAFTGSQGEVVTRFTDPAIAESSGLVVAGDRWVTVNDSGDDGQLYLVDPATGATLDTVRFADDAVDTEALAPESDDVVWVGDIGDNRARRDQVTVYRVPLDGGEVTSIDLVYPDGPRDAETLLRHPVTGELYLVSKKILGGNFYRVPTSGPQPRTLEKLGGAPSIATDGTFLDADTVLVRNYGKAYVLAWPSGRRLGEFSLPDQQQGEAVAAESPTSVLLSSEGVNAEVLRVTVPAEARGSGQPSPEPTSSGTSSPGPSSQGPSSPGPSSSGTGAEPSESGTVAPDSTARAEPTEGAENWHRWTEPALWLGGLCLLAGAVALVARRVRR